MCLGWVCAEGPETGASGEKKKGPPHLALHPKDPSARAHLHRVSWSGADREVAGVQVKGYVGGEKNKDNGGDTVCFLVLMERRRKAEELF